MPELRLAAYVDAERDRILATLIDWLRIPSISSLPEHHGDVRRSAERTAELLTREAGSGPEEALGRILEAPVLYLGIALAGDRFHAPNERMLIDQFEKGLLCAGELWHELAAALSPT